MRSKNKVERVRERADLVQRAAEKLQRMAILENYYFLRSFCRARTCARLYLRLCVAVELACQESCGGKSLKISNRCLCYSRSPACGVALHLRRLNLPGKVNVSGM